MGTKKCEICSSDYFANTSNRYCSTLCKTKAKLEVKKRWRESNRDAIKKYNNSPRGIELSKKRVEKFKKNVDMKQKTKSYHQKYRSKRGTAEYNGHLKRNYNITLDVYNEMLKEQDHKCAICQNEETKIDPHTKKPSRLAVDHCHKTGKVRGLLCFMCNYAIGKFKDNITYLKRAIEYLKKTGDVS